MVPIITFSPVVLVVEGCRCFTMVSNIDFAFWSSEIVVRQTCRASHTTCLLGTGNACARDVTCHFSNRSERAGTMCKWSGSPRTRWPRVFDFRNFWIRLTIFLKKKFESSSMRSTFFRSECFVIRDRNKWWECRLCCVLSRASVDTYSGEQHCARGQNFTNLNCFHDFTARYVHEKNQFDTSRPPNWILHARIGQNSIWQGLGVQKNIYLSFSNVFFENYLFSKNHFTPAAKFIGLLNSIIIYYFLPLAR